MIASSASTSVGIGYILFLEVDPSKTWLLEGDDEGVIRVDGKEIEAYQAILDAKGNIWPIYDYVAVEEIDSRYSKK